MKAKLKNDCKIKVVAWDNESVLTAPDWNACYDIVYEKLGIDAPLAGDPSRGKHYKKMLSVEIEAEINQHLKTFTPGDEESNYLQSYSCSHIGSEEFWYIACKYGFKLEPTRANIKAIRSAQRYLLQDRQGNFRVLPEVIKILSSLMEVMPQYILSNTNPEIYQGIKDAGFMQAIPEKNRLFSIFTKCRKPSPESYDNLVKCSGCEPEQILFIDDKDSNIEAARSHGINGIVFNGKKESHETLISRLSGFGIIVYELAR